MSLGTVVLILLVLALVGALPHWGYNDHWSYAASGGIGLILLIVIILLITGRL